MKECEQILEMATRLFYRNGFHATDMTEVAAKAGVTEAVVREHYPAKDDLILAVMQRRDDIFREWFDKELKRRDYAPQEQLLGAFQILQDWYEAPGFHGCMFINASIEFAREDNPVHQAAARHKKALYAYFYRMAQATAAKNPKALSKQLVLLMEGAIVTTQVTGSPDAARQARRAAEVLVKQALR